MKIILSRKGFDSGTGGVASPIFADGALVSLPIPDQSPQIRYSELSWRGHHLGQLVESLTRRRINRHCGVHLDPDIYAEICPRRPDWRSLFGQDGAAQSHLANQGVGVGDLFLFFGWFREVSRVGRGYRYVATAPDRHVIYGWLQVGQILQGCQLTSATPPWAAHHPHSQGNRGFRNTLYVATDKLTLPTDQKTPALLGAGVFSTCTEPQILTAPDGLRTQWRLPHWFYPAGRPPLSYHTDMQRWQQDDCYTYLRSAARGQEFVLDTTYYPEALAWLATLLNR